MKRGQQGFTLLELLVVMAILVALSVSMVDIVQHEDNQNRFDISRTRLNTLRLAIVGESYLSLASTNTTYNNLSQQSYLADNGLWPSSINELYKQPSSASDFALLEPVFDQTPTTSSTCSVLDDPSDNTGRVDDAGATLDLLSISHSNGSNGSLLAKGYRNTYVPLQAGDSDFLDGWGSPFVLDSSSDPLTLTSLGSNAAMGTGSVPTGEPNYTGDIALTVPLDDFQQPIDGWTVTLENLPDATEIASWGTWDENWRIGASLLLFENTDSNSQLNWRRISSDVFSIPSVGWSVGQTITFTFKAATITASENFNFACRTWLPPGRHLLVIYHDEDADPHQGNNETPRMAFTMEIYPRQGVLAALTHSWDRARDNVDTSPL